MSQLEAYLCPSSIYHMILHPDLALFYHEPQPEKLSQRKNDSPVLWKTVLILMEILQEGLYVVAALDNVLTIDTGLHAVGFEHGMELQWQRQMYL